MITTTRNKAPNGFVADVWIENAGNALGAEDDPNTTAPDLNTNVITQGRSRIVAIPAGIFLSGSVQISSWCVGGTSCTVRSWWYDDRKGLWVPNGAIATLTTATTNAANQTVGCMPGSRWFVQVVTNTGVTKLIYSIR